MPWLERGEDELTASLIMGIASDPSSRSATLHQGESRIWESFGDRTTYARICDICIFWSCIVELFHGVLTLRLCFFTVLATFRSTEYIFLVTAGEKDSLDNFLVTLVGIFPLISSGRLVTRCDPKDP